MTNSIIFKNDAKIGDNSKKSKPMFLAKNIFLCVKLYSTRNAVLKKLQRQIQ
jgi:hypothetical protein